VHFIYAFFGVAFFLGVTFFFGAAAFADFFTGVVVLDVVLVTRPDLVLPRTAGFSTIAGACECYIR